MILGSKIRNRIAAGIIGLAGLVNSGCTYEENRAIERGMTNLIEGPVAESVAGGAIKQRAIETNNPGAYEAVDYLQRLKVAQEGRSQNSTNIYFNNKESNSDTIIQNKGREILGRDYIETEDGELGIQTATWFDNGDRIVRVPEELEFIGKTTYRIGDKFGILVEDRRENGPSVILRSDTPEMIKRKTHRFYDDRNRILILSEDGEIIYKDEFIGNESQFRFNTNNFTIERPGNYIISFSKTSLGKSYKFQIPLTVIENPDSITKE